MKHFELCINKMNDKILENQKLELQFSVNPYEKMLSKLSPL